MEASGSVLLQDRIWYIRVEACWLLSTSASPPLQASFAPKNPHQWRWCGKGEGRSSHSLNMTLHLLAKWGFLTSCSVCDSVSIFFFSRSLPAWQIVCSANMLSGTKINALLWSLESSSSLEKAILLECFCEGRSSWAPTPHHRSVLFCVSFFRLALLLACNTWFYLSSSSIWLAKVSQWPPCLASRFSLRETPHHGTLREFAMEDFNA